MRFVHPLGLVLALILAGFAAGCGSGAGPATGPVVNGVPQVDDSAFRAGKKEAYGKKAVTKAPGDKSK